MKKSLITFACFLLGLFSNTTNAQIISVGPGTDFSIGSGTVVSADSLDITPSVNFIFNGCSIGRSIVANNGTSIPYINKVYQFSNTTNAFSGALKMFYSNASLNGLNESGLKFLIHNGNSWSLDNNSSVNTTNKFVQNNAVNGVALKELTAATCTPTSSIDTINACGSYIWHGTTYIASNSTATWTGMNAAGCDSVVTLNLTITASTSNTSGVTTCDSYIWSVNGQTYSTSGTYTSVNGCHTEILNLTISSSSRNYRTASACDSYTWSENNVTYTNSGTYIYSYTNSNGCSVIETLYLTIKQSVTPSVSISSNATNNTINCGSSVTFTATPTNGGINPIYQWKLNGNNVVGANNAIYINNNLSDSDVISVVMTVNNNLTVNIGNQTWMNKNLDVSTYNNGDVIPQITDSISWVNANYGAWCYYNNDSATYAAKYGKLYNWYAINDSRGLAPVGFHVPSLEEWQTLNTTLGAGLGAGNALKSTSDWLTNNGSNASGFNAYPGGARILQTSTVSSFYAVGNLAAWWATNLYNDSLPFITGIVDSLVSDVVPKSFGLSIRCIKNEYSSAPVVITVNNTPTVNIGAQTWMDKNLNVSTYNNGDVIPQITDSISWVNATYGAWCYYNNDSATYAAKYGKLYNWYAINDSRGLAPVGYHVPSLEEWQTMSKSLGGGLGAGNALKSTSDWTNNIGTNASGFNAYPGGARILQTLTVSSFDGVGDIAAWWAIDLYNDSLPFITGILDSLVSDVVIKSFGLSVRCIKNEYDATNDVLNCYTTNTASSNTISTSVIYNHDTTTAFACDRYTWSVNNQTYTSSGTYTWTGTNVAGCDSMITLILTINSPSSSSDTVSACTSYTWNGTTYTTSGNYTFNTTNSNGCDSVANLALTINTCNTTLNLNAFIEGFYSGSSTMVSSMYDQGISTDATATDTITVNLHASSPSVSATPSYSVNVILHNNGTATAIFPGATLGNSYYIALKHRNHLETWSAEPVTLGAINSYDFTNSASSAYSDGVNAPMKMMSGNKYALYAGDVNQDGTIDLFDLLDTENDASNFTSGYNASDVNGDATSDLFDLILIENNSTLFIFVASPVL